MSAIKFICYGYQLIDCYGYRSGLARACVLTRMRPTILLDETGPWIVWCWAEWFSVLLI